MIERLYAIQNDSRIEIDLPNPSGITLRFNSPMFDDVTKISNSYSYSFNLPKTVHNRKVFECVEDVRSSTTTFSRRTKCEYTADGLTFFDNAYLYISEIEPSTYTCCMVWGVIEGLEHLKDHGGSINELDENGDYTKTTKKTSYSGTNARDLMLYGSASKVGMDYPKVITPNYGIGVPYNSSTTYGISFCSRVAEYDYETLEVLNHAYICPNPAIRMDYLIQKINRYYGINLKLTKDGALDADSISKGDIFSHGIIPCVKSETSSLLNEAMSIRLTKPHLDDSFFQSTGFSVLYFETLEYPSFDDNDMIEMYKSYNINISLVNNYGENESPYFYGFVARRGASVELDGKLSLYYNSIPDEDNKPRVCVWRMKRVYEYTKVIFDGEAEYHHTFHLEKDGDDYEVFSMEGEFDFEKSDYPRNGREHNGTRNDYPKYIYNFNFKKNEGRDRIDFGIAGKGSNEMCGGRQNFSYPRDYFVYILVVNGNVKEFSDLKIIPKFENGVVYDHVHGRESLDYYTDLFPNLPDISCTELVKSLFYMGGGFPILDKDKNIVLARYSDIKQNRINKNIYDWSSYLIDTEEPKISLKVSDFAQHNYYLMKNQSEDNSSESEDNEDVYSNDKLDIKINNHFLSKSKNVIQVPFYGKYLRQGTNHSVETGDGMKLWKFEDGVYSSCEGKPCAMILNHKTIGYLYEYFGADVWTFDNMPSMEYLQEILTESKQIEVDMVLNPTILASIDYCKPVYLRQYNSYFAIVNIEFTTGSTKSKVSLIKLPN